VVGQKDLFCLEENELDIKDLINEPLPCPPRDVVLQSHWLAIYGRQPLLATNLDDKEKDDEDDRRGAEKRKAKREPKKGTSGLAHLPADV
jgi:transcription initiation factor TFIID subunit 6